MYYPRYHQPMDIIGWLLIVGFTLRLTRFIITDSLGHWWIQDPIDRAMARYADRKIAEAQQAGTSPEDPWWWKYRAGLWCPYCVGFWVGVAVIASYLLWGHTELWKVVAGAFTLNWVTAHVGARLGDAEGNDD